MSRASWCTIRRTAARSTRQEITDRGDSLDLSWLKDDRLDQGELPEPSALAEEATVELSAPMEELRAILLELGEDAATLDAAGVLT